jgi:hypothetical protein
MVGVRALLGLILVESILSMLTGCALLLLSAPPRETPAPRPAMA